MGQFDVSENIGFDGYQYYCKRCGRAGYSKPAQVRGHLAMCPGTLIRKGVSTASYSQLSTGNSAGLYDRGANQLQPVRNASGGGLSSGQLQPVAAVVGPVNYQLEDQYRQLDKRIAAMENEYNHLLLQRNFSQGGSWVSKNLGWLVLGGIMLLALFSSFSQQSCQCPTGVGQSQSTSRSGYLGLSSLGSKLVGKAAERAMMKSVDRMFG